MTDYREPGVIDKAFAGKEDHGIPTCSIGISFKGAYQSFGNLCLNNDDHLKDFVADLCAAFGVKKLKDLVGKKCVAYRCFAFETIEALEAPSGKKFVITNWRRKHFSKKLAPDPLTEKRRSIERDIQFHERRIVEQRAALERIESEYHPVPE